MTRQEIRSEEAFGRAKRLMPGGVNSPVRAYGSVGRTPVFAREAKGAWVTDVDGNRYVDHVGSYGPLILGHAPDAVVEAVQAAASRGTSFGMPTELENELAARVVRLVPGMERLRFVNSGTEATMSALRVARANTGRDKIVKCAGCYHGHSDGLLVQAGSGAATHGAPSSPGVPASATRDTVVVPYNDLAALERALAEHAGEVAAVILEPVAGNMGCVPPAEGYLAGLRRACDEHGSLLVFDEVMTGFRVALGGAQARYGVTPDLTCLGKIVGGGLPCAAYGGRGDLMGCLSPEGKVYQSGTLSGNPLAMAAGIATLDAIEAEGAHERLEATGARLAAGLESAAREAGARAHVSRVGSMWSCFFSRGPIRNFDDAAACDTEAFARFFGAMLERGVLLPPSQYETCFLSTSHDAEAIERTLAAAPAAFAAAASG